MNDNSNNIFLEEKYFPSKNMSKDERNYYLNIIKNCKDICNSEHKVSTYSNCDIVEMHFKKEKETVYFNGSLAIGDDKHTEYRCISGEIWNKKSTGIVVEMLVTRLKSKSGPESYKVVDEFVLVDGKLLRNSYYNYDIKTFVEEVDNNEMRVKLK